MLYSMERTHNEFLDSQFYSKILVLPSVASISSNMVLHTPPPPASVKAIYTWPESYLST